MNITIHKVVDAVDKLFLYDIVVFDNISINLKSVL